MDLSDRTMVVAAAKEASALFGRIDILFNNAGTLMSCMRSSVNLLVSEAHVMRFVGCLVLLSRCNRCFHE